MWGYGCSVREFVLLHCFSKRYSPGVGGFIFLVLQARTTVLSVGFSLAFGAMFSKTWRVHKIFTAAKTLKKMVGYNVIITFRDSISGL